MKTGAPHDEVFTGVDEVPAKAGTGGRSASTGAVASVLPSERDDVPVDTDDQEVQKENLSKSNDRKWHDKLFNCDPWSVIRQKKMERGR